MEPRTQENEEGRRGGRLPKDRRASLGPTEIPAGISGVQRAVTGPG